MSPMSIALKRYDTMNFPLIFQNELLQTLERLEAGGRFPHALIFEGAPGSGKKTAAGYAASMLLCRDERNAPCGDCSSCRKSLENHPDHTTLLPENKSKTISVDKVREIKLSAYITPHESKRKVYFIPEAQRLRPEAQNALLKLIEEPPEAAYFIMTTPSRSNLLETVISRSAVIPMRELTAEERLTVLQKLLPGQNGSELKKLAFSCRTVGEALRSVSDPAAAGLSADAARLLADITSGERYNALTLLYRYEKDRESYLRLLQAVRMSVISELCSADNSSFALRSNKIIDIIDKTVFSAAQNAALPLLSCAAVNRLIEAAHSA